MMVPLPQKRNIAFHYDINASLAEAGLRSFSITGRQKNLRRLPHIFSRVLELPFHAEADVSVQEDEACFRFALITDQITGDVEAHLVEVIPGVSKIIIRGENMLELSFDELELDLWRFRLPPSTRPDLAKAAYIAGELIITVPKSADCSDESAAEGEEENGPNGKDDWREASPDAEINGGYGSGDGGASTNGSAKLQELDCKVNVGSSIISRLEPLVLVQ
ncbi:uncharacterized protein LOC116249318 [Nymphaea colorata]|nr:uncharacterized protein LOC116249318 [Nymphaea colorata]